MALGRLGGLKSGPAGAVALSTRERARWLGRRLGRLLTLLKTTNLLADAKIAASPEDIILYKLQTWRRQDQADIENLLTNRRGLDRAYIVRHLTPLEQSTGAPMRERWDEIT